MLFNKKSDFKMQISSKLFNQQQLKQFSSTTEELQDLQNKIATGENILRASDDPVGSVELSGLNVVKSYKNNRLR